MRFFSKIESFLLQEFASAFKRNENCHPVSPQQRVFAHRMRNTKISYLEIFERVEGLMQKNQVFLRQNLDSTELAKMAGTNRLYLSRAVKFCSGETLRDYVGKYRVNFSMQTFMRTPTLRVADLAYVSGFNSAASFNNAFKRVHKKTPGQWCQEYRRNLVARK